MPLQPTKEAAAAQVAAQVIAQINNVVSQVSNAIEKGIPARGNNPAISAEELKAALGKANLAQIEAAKQALS